MLHGRRANLLRLEHTQSTPLHHGWSAHADVAVLGGNDHVATTQQRGIAGKAAPGRYAHHRHPTVEPGKAGKGAHMQPSHDGHVHITRAATSTLGKQHHRQPVLQGQAQHAVGLLVVAHALRARQHGSVVGHGHHLVAVDAANAGDHAIGRGVLDQVFLASAAALCRNRQRAVFDETAGIAQVGHVLPRAAKALGVAFGHGFGAAGIQRESLAIQKALQVSARRVYVALWRGRSRFCRHTIHRGHWPKYWNVFGL